jgi:hypothetical protein
MTVTDVFNAILSNKDSISPEFIGNKVVPVNKDLLYMIAENAYKRIMYRMDEIREVVLQAEELEDVDLYAHNKIVDILFEENILYTKNPNKFDVCYWPNHNMNIV